jgi:hypothetical protein
MPRNSNLAEYARESVINQKKVGEIVLTAMQGGEIPDLTIQFGDDELLKKDGIVLPSLDINPDDTKLEVLAKLRSALANVLSEAEKHTTGMISGALASVAEEVEEVIEWVQK